eukprot:g15788.t1
MDFGAVLTRAMVTNNTLELADGTFFLGAPRLRSKLFIRPCYKYLSELILEGVFAADKSLTEFAAALTEAVVTDSTLELANGTVFLGSASRPAVHTREDYELR